MQRFLSQNPQIDSKTFIKKLNDPEFIIKTFLGSFSFDTDDQGNIIIRDSYDANIGRGDTNQSGRVKRFLTNLVPGKNYPMNIASGIAGLLGSAEGQGAPVEINLGTIEDIRKSVRPKNSKNEIAEQLASLD